MCGIFGYIGNKKNAAEIVFNGIKSLEYRGYDSWGVAAVSKKADRGQSRIQLKKKTGKIGLETATDLPLSFMALGHTRWATHGRVTDLNAHPHLDCSGSLALIHNGIIENYDQIKSELLASGHKFRSDTDSEVAIHLIEEKYRQLKSNKRQKKDSKILVDAVRLSFKRFTGLNAIIVMDSQSQMFVAAKNGSPLVIGKGSNENFLASDAHAILPYTKNVYFMEDWEMVSISKDKVTVDHIFGKPKDKISYTRLSWKVTKEDKGQIPHFMLKEIYDQPKAIEYIASHSTGDVNKLAQLIKKSFGTYLVGCGTAAYACLAGTYIFSKIAKVHLNFAVGSEFGYLVDFLTNKSLVIALSQSGETIDVIEAVKKARQKKAKIATIVNVLGSTLYRFADYKLLLNAGYERAVVSTKAFVAKLAYLIMIAYALNGKRNVGKTVLSDSVKSLENIFKKKNLKKIKILSKKLVRKKHIYIIGRGLSYPIALETALKIKEASYIHAEGFAAGELKHGVIALVEKGTPCIVFLPNDETYGDTMAGAMEMKVRGGYIIGISYRQHEIFDDYIHFDDCGIASAIPQVVVGQLLGYYMAVERGYDPDKPRNLAKSVTVK